MSNSPSVLPTRPPVPEDVDWYHVPAPVTLESLSSDEITLQFSITPVAEPASSLDQVDPTAGGKAPSKSQGRDYLMELLKK